MKPRSDEREDACTWRRSNASPTASETAQRPGVIARRSKVQEVLFSPSPSPISSQDLYLRFIKLFRHAFGNKRSPYRKQSQAWLSSLGKNNICDNCWQTGWKCDTKELRCHSCVEKHAICPRTLQFKKFLIMREMRITEDAYDKLVKLIPRSRNRRPGIGSSSSSHPPSREPRQIRQKSTHKHKQMKNVQSEVESEEEMDELDPSGPSSDDQPLQSRSLSNHSTAIPILSPGPTYVNRPMGITRLTQVGPARVTFRTTNRGPISSPISTSNAAPSSVPVAVANLDSARVIDELSGIRSVLTQMEENLSKFLSNHARVQSPVMRDRGTHITAPNPAPAIVSESLPLPNSEPHTTRFQMNTLGSETTGGYNSGAENAENTWYTQTSRERQFPRPTILGDSSDLMLGGRFRTPSEVLPMIDTLDDRDALTDR